MAYALYRFPYGREYFEVRQDGGDVESLPSFASLDGRSGFVFAPFRITSTSPLLLLRPDTVRRSPLKTGACGAGVSHKAEPDGGRRAYRRAFARFHASLVSGEFSKLVLSRCAIEEYSETLDPIGLFMRACELYPRMFVAVVSTDVSGTWLMATPETLLERSAVGWHTMALAGTMALGQDDTDASLEARRLRGDIEEWSQKNVMEQRYVARYISKCLERFTDDVRFTPPYTRRAGMVKHLASDFTFGMPDGADIGRLIGELHPTPAVCGIPKSAALDFITLNEGYDRRYYSGFAGPLDCGGSTRLFVTLRCMNMYGRKACLYAGGGLLPESEENNEWLETEAKMETMRRCLSTKRT